MKRYLNKLRTFTVSLVSGKNYRYQLSSGTPDENELFIGFITIDNQEVKKGLFIYKSGQIYSLSHDDFSYDFLNEENTRLNDAFSALVLPSTIVPIIPDEVPPTIISGEDGES
jgi:hypothetical protein